MKTKTILAGLLTAAVCMTMLTACSGSGEKSSTDNSSKAGSQTEQSSKADTSEQSKASEESKTEKAYPDTHTLYIWDAGKLPEITAIFFNTQSGKTEEVKMNRTEEKDDHFIYTCDGDVTKYNMVSLSYGNTETDLVSFNNFVSGWYLYNDELMPCTAGKTPTYDPKYEVKTMKFNGEDKIVYIWTPADYDAKSDTKYSTIYMFDAQSILSKELTTEMRVWNVCECVEGMMEATDNKAIIVALDNSGPTRFDELIPDLGKVLDGVETNKLGKQFSDFLTDTVLPYVEENYNVYTDAANTSVCGSSLGGLEAFYVGLEHPDKFGTVGALSASFQMFGEDSWKAYLEPKLAGKEFPFVYMYAGGTGTDTGICDQIMNNMLVNSGFPKDKIVYSKNEKGEHYPQYWRSIYPEFLEAMFTQKVSALESGALVEYSDFPENISEMPSVPSADDEEDSRPPEVKNYVYYDNSETKWDKVYAYWWGGNSLKNKITDEEGYYKDWPGFEMEKIEGTDIYRVAAPIGPTNIIFDSGVSDDDVRKGVTAYQTADLYYSSDVFPGQVYKIDTSVAPKPGKGIEKTKNKYEKGDWSRYNP